MGERFEGNLTPLLTKKTRKLYQNCTADSKTFVTEFVSNNITSGCQKSDGGNIQLQPSEIQFFKRGPLWFY